MTPADAAFDLYQQVHDLYRKGVTSWDDVIDAWNDVGRVQGAWAGLPYPVSGIPLIMEPRFSFEGFQGATTESFMRSRLTDAELMAKWLKIETEVSARRIERVKKYKWDKKAAMKRRMRTRLRRHRNVIAQRNHWYSRRLDATIHIYESVEGKIWGEIAKDDWKVRFRLLDDTLRASEVWSERAEHEATKTLKELISPLQYREYVLTGCFIEVSKRSNLTYFIRKSRPTIVVSPKGKVIVTLCLHAQGYYRGTWAGVMVPTDDVITHLLYIRGDEKKFWGKANHHPPHSVLSGI